MRTKKMSSLPEGSVMFDYDALDHVAPQPEDPRTEWLRSMHVFLRDQVLCRNGDRIPPIRSIAGRVIVLDALLSDDAPSLAQVARQTGWSRANLSKLALSYSDRLGISAPWQRIGSRDLYAERAAAVHAGEWATSEHRQLHVLRERKRAQAKQQAAVAAGTTTTYVVGRGLRCAAPSQCATQ
jgi:hypothetical protein